MGEGAIDGRGGASYWLGGVLEEPKTWWDLAEDARKAGHQEVFRLVEADHADNLTLYQITLKNSPNVHVSFQHGNGMTVWGVRVDCKKQARNADGINPSSSKNVTITQSYIRAGDDNVAIKAGSGKTQNISIVHNHFYWGHGMSIGSETNGGVTGVYVSDLSLDGPDNGLRIKSNPSRGGLVQEVIYDNVCIRNSRHPSSWTLPTTSRRHQVKGAGLPRTCSAQCARDRRRQDPAARPRCHPPHWRAVRWCRALRPQREVQIHGKPLRHHVGAGACELPALRRGFDCEGFTRTGAGTARLRGMFVPFPADALTPAKDAPPTTVVAAKQ